MLLFSVLQSNGSHTWVYTILPLEGLLRLWVFISVNLGWGLIIHIFHKLPGGADAAGLRTTLWEPLLKSKGLLLWNSPPHPTWICTLILGLLTLLVFRYPSISPDQRYISFSFLIPYSVKSPWASSQHFLPIPFAPDPSCLPWWTSLSPSCSVNMSYFLASFLEQLYEWHQLLLYFSLHYHMASWLWVLAVDYSGLNLGSASSWSVWFWESHLNSLSLNLSSVKSGCENKMEGCL